MVSPQEMVPAEFVDPIVGKFIPQVITPLLVSWAYLKIKILELVNSKLMCSFALQARKVRWANTRRINVQEFRSILADTTKVDLQVCFNGDIR